MALTPEELEAVFIGVESDYTQSRTPTALSRQSLKAGVDAIDAWVTDVMASFLAALPVDVRQGTTTKQKVRMLLHVINKRWEVE